MQSITKNSNYHNYKKEHGTTLWQLRQQVQTTIKQHDFVQRSAQSSHSKHQDQKNTGKQAARVAV
jgi:hypothetical protein